MAHRFFGVKINGLTIVVIDHSMKQAQGSADTTDTSTWAHQDAEDNFFLVLFYLKYLLLKHDWCNYTGVYHNPTRPRAGNSGQGFTS